MIGTLGGIVFQVSSSRVFTFGNLTRTGGAQYQKHEVILSKAKLEFLRPELDTISLPIRLDKFLGVDPLTEINKMQEYKDVGYRLPLIIGGKFYGHWVIEKIGETWKNLDNRGNIIVAEINLDLLESVPG